MTAIGQLRRERGLSQKQFATAVNRSTRTVRAWECGETRPVDTDFEKIAEVLKCNIAIVWMPPKVPVYQRTRSAEEEAIEAANKEKIAPYIERHMALGLTKRDLAKRSGVSESTIREMEKGRSFPQWETRQRLRRALGMPEERFYSTEERNAIFLELQEQAVISKAISRNITPLRAVNADLDDLEQELNICALRAIERYNPDGPASVKTFVDRNVTFFIKEWIVKLAMHGLSGNARFPRPNISVVSLDALMEKGFDIEG